MVGGTPCFWLAICTVGEWTKSNSHHFETMGNHCSLVFRGKSSLQGLLGGARSVFYEFAPRPLRASGRFSQAASRLRQLSWNCSGLPRSHPSDGTPWAAFSFGAFCGGLRFLNPLSAKTKTRPFSKTPFGALFFEVAPFSQNKQPAMLKIPFEQTGLTDLLMGK